MLRALCFAITVFVIPLEFASGDPVADPNTNAALSYWQAFATLPHLTDAEQNKLTSECLAMPLDAPTRELVDKADYALQMMHRGAALPQCDWGVSPEDGIYARLPHGPAARVLSSLACLRARIRFEEGRNAPAISDILAGLALGRHVSQDGLLIVLLFGYNIEHRMADALAQYLPKLNAKEIQDVKTRLATLPAAGSAAKSLLIEEKFGLDWLIRIVKDTKDQDKLLAQLAPLFMKEGPGRSTPQEQVAKAGEFVKACGGSADGIIRFAEKIRPSYASLASKFDLPPSEFEKEFQNEEKKQAGNPVFELMFPALRKVHQQQSRAHVRRALLSAAIAVQLDGPGAQKNVPDPVIGEPFEYAAFEGGFQLRSKLKGQDNHPLSITIDRRGK
ncbi:MAG TPA: hypothetical protein VGX70_00255 [Gemmataceae bacterium]|jgi:hypothetical protein|nr:hypothetical protein [Gemmataceae bacterium]